VNGQYGIGNSKYVIIFDPLLTSHVTPGMRSKLLALNTPFARSSKHRANVEQMYSKYTC